MLSPLSLTIVLLAGLWVALAVVQMPHCHSAAAFHHRHLRAVRCGFVSPKPIGMKHVLVPSALRAPIKTFSKASQAHLALGKLTGRPHHFLSHAVLDAKPYLSKETTRDLLLLTRKANRAKHNISCAAHYNKPGATSWADLSDEDLFPALPLTTKAKCIDEKDHVPVPSLEEPVGPHHPAGQQHRSGRVLFQG